MLQLPGEMSSALNADHHTACKFKDHADANYRSVKNALKYLIRSTSQAGVVSPIVSAAASDWRSDLATLDTPIIPTEPDALAQIESALGVHESADEDLHTNRCRILEGTCHWIVRQPSFLNWITASAHGHRAQMFWLFGPPATGKTALTTVVVNHLQSLRYQCQYHFFSSGHQAKRTVAYCLRSIASQLASTDEGFRHALLSFHRQTGISFTSQSLNATVIWKKIFEGIIFKYRFDKPLFWVLDGIDEAESQPSFVSMLVAIQSRTPIHIFLSSRPMKVPTSSVAPDRSIIPYFLRESDTEVDIRAYVTSAIRSALPDHGTVQEDITDLILQKASGSFLWVRLALETLEDNWHTQDDIRQTLSDIPDGMTALYDKMLQSIRSQSPRIQSLAHRILMWAACSWRPLGLDELKIALEPDYQGFLKLEETINQICGHFVSVIGHKITLIHDTARQFLLSKRDGAPAFVESRDTHAHMAMTCLKFLSSERWRTLFKPFSAYPAIDSKSIKQNRLRLAERDHPFLGYSVVYWAFHVSKSNKHSQELDRVLIVFCSRYCLSWIEAISLSGNLRYLTKSAQYLKVYAKRRSRSSPLDSPGPPTSLKVSERVDPAWILGWATDFIRIASKFGPSLVSHPCSIYRDVPPFCPRASMVGRAYSNPNTGMLSVTGLSSDTWDDCLAAVSVGEDLIASKVLATDAYFITLVSVTGSITIWHAETCERARVIEVGEYVPLMVLSPAGTLLATASFTGYQVWEISSGRKLYQLSKTEHSRSLMISFGATDTELIIGLEDATLTCVDLDTREEVWRYAFQPPTSEYQSCPGAMALSPDQKKVALSWRGRSPLVWHLTEPHNPQPEQCRNSDSRDSLCGPERMIWQTDSGSLLVLCQNMDIVQWHLYREEQVEFRHTKAREMALSRDANFLLTSDYTGTMSVWSFPHLSLVYRLIIEDDFVRDITFSPDGQRFYDTRDSMCYVWEPDALVRLDEHELEDNSSLGGISSAVTEPVISTNKNPQGVVTALAAGANDEYYCCGRDDGMVAIHNTAEGIRLRKVYAHSSHCSVLSLAWSPSGRYMVSSDEAARIIAKRLEVKAADKWAVFPVLDHRIVAPVQQFLFSPDEVYLLVSTTAKDRLFHLRSKQEVLVRDRQGKGRWTSHPFREDVLIWVTANEAIFHTWENLAPQTTRPMPGSVTEEAAGCCHIDYIFWTSVLKSTGDIVYGAIASLDHQLSVAGLSHRDMDLGSFNVSALDEMTSSTLATSDAPDLSAHIKRLVGVFQEHLIFLDHEYWLCSWDLTPAATGMKKHFFLPKDWLNASSLETARINEHGTFFCPRFGDVAIVKNGIRL